MSKNVAIKEGQTAKSFSDVAKLKTNLVGGGTATWVPEDETQLVEKTITQNGEYLPSSDSAYGFSKVTVDIDLPTKSITANGTYNASSDNKEGWSKVTVNVPTEGASGTDTSGNPYSITDDDFGLPTYTDSNGDDYDVEVDTDPQTGEPTVTLTKLPKSIVVTAGSLTYNDGDAFDKSRYTVKANWDTAGGTQSDVTASCTFYPANGTILHYGTEYTMTVEWTYKGRTYRTANNLTINEVAPIPIPDGSYTVNGNSVSAESLARMQQGQYVPYPGASIVTITGTSILNRTTGDAVPSTTNICSYQSGSGMRNALITFCQTSSTQPIRQRYTENGDAHFYETSIHANTYTVTKDGVSKTITGEFAVALYEMGNYYARFASETEAQTAILLVLAFGSGS